MKTIPVILCGGGGTRLWPLSRLYYPKQLLALIGEYTLLQQTVQRAIAISSGQSPYIICNVEHRFLVKDQLEEIGITNATIILEPFGRSTAAAIAIAALEIISKEGNAIMMVMASDHLIRDQNKFIEAVRQAEVKALEHNLVVFGINPTEPATGYGYIKGKMIGLSEVEAFVEKPDLQTAKKYLESGDYYWNSGMFMFDAEEVLREIKIYAPEVFEISNNTHQNITASFGFLMIPEKEFQLCPDISIDYAIMEKTKKAIVVPMDVGWSDLGCWQSMWAISDKDENNNAVIGDVYHHGVKNSYIRGGDKLLTAVGVENLVVVDTPDALLVASRDKVQQVKDIVTMLKKDKREETYLHKKVLRPWGSYETLEESSSYKVKRLIVKPNARLSLQSHKHRSEHWVVVKGTATVTCGGNVFQLTQNESTFIPKGEKHRLENRIIDFLEVIEVQTGSYLGEDDITRYDDQYGR